MCYLFHPQLKDMGMIIISILLMKELRLKDVKGHAQCHLVSKLQLQHELVVYNVALSLLCVYADLWSLYVRYMALGIYKPHSMTVQNRY